MENLSLYEYQNEILKVYSETKKIFDKYDVKLVANSGTLLGIIRHNNDFIPWDDDLDFLVSYKKYKDNYSEIRKDVDKNPNIHLFDFINNEENLPGNLIMARVYSTKKFTLVDDDSKFETWPFIDIFFMVPSIAFKTQHSWVKYERLHKMRWMTRKGFKRYLSNVGNEKLILKKNLKSLPIKLTYWNCVHDYRILKPYKKSYPEESWNLLRRADKWSGRDVVYKMNNLITKKIRNHEVFINGDFNSELENTFGKNWNKEIVDLPHFKSSSHTKHLRNIKIIEYLSENY